MPLYKEVTTNQYPKICNDLKPMLKNNNIVLLKGDLGAGKTTFAKCLCESFGVDANKVTSPTFNIEHIYDGEIPIYHYDLYRIKHEAELMQLDLAHAIESGLVIIEWPQIIEDALREKAILIDIIINNNNTRNINVSLK
jgi:tRNA threonylcarbamoyladenosine biosynthesis protein TsaE